MGNQALIQMDWELDSILNDYSSSKTSKAQTLKKLEEHYLKPSNCYHYLSSGNEISDGLVGITEDDVKEAQQLAVMELATYLRRQPLKKFKQINVHENVYRSIKELSQKLKMPLAGTVNYILDRAEKYEILKKEKDDFFNEKYWPLLSFVDRKLDCNKKQLDDFLNQDDWVQYEKSLEYRGGE